jgi:hypothetical protein
MLAVGVMALGGDASGRSDGFWMNLSMCCFILDELDRCGGILGEFDGCGGF